MSSLNKRMIGDIVLENINQASAEEQSRAALIIVEIQQEIDNKDGEALLDKLNHDRVATKQFCDIDLVVADKKLQAHRFVLSALSGYFSAMLQMQFVEYQCGEVQITGPHMAEISPSMVEQAVEFMYTGSLNIGLNNIHDILFIAEYLQISTLTDFAIEFLQWGINDESWLETYRIALQLDNKNLVSQCLQALQICLQDISFDGFTSEEVIVVAETFFYYRTLSDEHMLEKILTWVHRDDKKNRDSFKYLSKFVDLGMDARKKLISISNKLGISSKPAQEACISHETLEHLQKNKVWFLDSHYARSEHTFQEIQEYCLERRTLRRVSMLPKGGGGRSGMQRKYFTSTIVNQTLHVISLNRVDNKLCWKDERYELRHKKWHTIDISHKFDAKVVVTTVSNTLYILDQQMIYKYNPDKGTVTAFKRLHQQRFFPALVAVGNILYIIGGHSFPFEPLQSCEAYNMVTGEEIHIPDMMEPRRFATAIKWGTEGILVLGGLDQRGAIVKQTEMFLFETCEWKHYMFTVKHWEFGFTAFVHQDKLFVVGRNQKLKNKQELYCFQSGESDWTVQQVFHDQFRVLNSFLFS